MVDADSGRIIDMIDSRETGDVAEWLGKFPSVEIVSRDGSQSYAAAIKKGLPNAVQISDRFHLLKGLCDAAVKCFQQLFQGRVAIPMTSESAYRQQIIGLGTKAEKARLVKTLYGEGRTSREVQTITGMNRETVSKYLRMENACVPEKRKQTVRGKEHDDAVAKVQSKADLVRQLKEEGSAIDEIRRKTGFAYSAVKSYLSDNFTPINGHYGRRREGKLYQFRELVLQMRAQDKTYAQIHEAIKVQGYTGTADAIRGFVSKERRVVHDLQDRFGQVELIEKKWIIKFLYKPLREIAALTREQLSAVLKTYPLARMVFSFSYRFKNIVKRRDTDKLKKWIDDAAASGIEEIRSFAKGLKNDLTAVMNALLYDYSYPS